MIFSSWPSPLGRYLCFFASIRLSLLLVHFRFLAFFYNFIFPACFTFQLSLTGWRSEVKDPDTGKWVEDTKLFRQRRLLLHGAASQPASPAGGPAGGPAGSPAGGLGGGRGSPAGYPDQWETESAVSGLTEAPPGSRDHPRRLSGDSLLFEGLEPSAPAPPPTPPPTPPLPARAAPVAAKAGAQFAGLGAKQAADLKAAWNKILG
jgi:hypothetical protein